MLARRGCHVDNPPELLLFHQRQHQSCEQNDACEIRADHGLNLLFAERVKFGKALDSRVVDEDINPAKARDGLLNKVCQS
jgi:hypothetical protein